MVLSDTTIQIFQKCIFTFQKWLSLGEVVAQASEELCRYWTVLAYTQDLLACLVASIYVTFC